MYIIHVRAETPDIRSFRRRPLVGERLPFRFIADHHMRICGPVAMVAAALVLWDELGTSPERIACESFGGVLSHGDNLPDTKEYSISFSLSGTTYTAKSSS